MSVEDLATVIMGELQWINCMTALIILILTLSVIYLVIKIKSIENELYDIKYDTEELRCTKWI